MRVRDMQGTPAHIETLVSTDGVRRHPAHCLFANGRGKKRKCSCKRCPLYNQNCSSASRCDYYEDNRYPEQKQFLA